MKWSALLNGRTEAKDVYFKVDDSPTDYFVPGRSTTKMTIGDTPTLASVVHGSTITIGIVDVVDHKTYFGDLLPLPFKLSSKKYKWSHHYNFPPVVVSETDIVVFAEYPGQGIGMARGKVDPYSLSVEFGDPSFIPPTYFNASGVYLTGAVADGEDLFLSVGVRRMHDGCVSPRGTTLPACSDPGKHELYLVKSVKGTWSKDKIYDTDGATLADSCGFSYFVASDNSDYYYYAGSRALQEERALQEAEAGNDYYYVPSWRDFDTKAERDAWAQGGLMVDGVVFRSKMVKTASAVALTFAVKRGGDGFKVYRVDKTADCGFAPPLFVNSTELAPCKMLKTAALSGTDVVFFWCAPRKAVLCNIVTGLCGPHYADYGTLAAGSGTGATAGGSIDCPTKALCVISSNTKVLQFLTIDSSKMTIEGVFEDNTLSYKTAGGTEGTEGYGYGYGYGTGGGNEATEANGQFSFYYYLEDATTLKTNSAQLFMKANDDLTSDVVAIAADHVFIGLQYAPVASETSGGLLSSIQSDYPADASACPSALNACSESGMAKGTISGVLLWDKGSTWSYSSDTHGCDYYRSTQGDSSVSITDYDICGSRDVCEAACTDTANCAAFTFEPKTSVCNLYGPVCTVGASEGKTLVSKAEIASCKITVSGAKLPPDITCDFDEDSFVMTNCELSGEYVQDSATAYSTASNSSKIYADATQPCLGWVLGLNTATPSTITLTTYKNAPKAVVDLYADALSASAGFGSSAGWNTACELLCTDVGSCPIDSVAGVPGQWNCTNAGVQALCPDQCLPPESATVADQAVTYHVVSPAEPYEFTASFLAYDELLPPDQKNGAGSCATSCDCTGIKKKKPCTSDELVLFFCFDTCRREEKIYEQSEVEYLDGSGTFEMIYRTFPNGTCAEDTVVPPYGYPLPVDYLKKHIYPATVPQNPALSMDKVCNTMADLGSCPALTSCVMSYEEQAVQVALVRGAVPKSAWVTLLTQAERTAMLRSNQWNDVDMTGKFPKMVFSPTRSDAFIRKEITPYFKETFLPVPGHNRIRFYGTQVGVGSEGLYTLKDVSTILVTVVPPEDTVTVQELGRLYRGPPGYDTLISDIFRVEAFDENDAPTPGMIEFEMKISDPICVAVAVGGAGTSKTYVCDPQPMVLVWTPESDVPQRITDIGGKLYHSLLPDSKAFNWWTVQLPAGYAQADVAVTTDVDECALGTDDCQDADEGGSCTNTDGGYYCKCLSGYKGTDGTPPRTRLDPGVQCVLDRYIPADTHFLVIPEDDVEYGWKVGEVLVFESYDATLDTCVGMCGGKDTGLSPDCHYGVEVLERASSSSPNTYVKNLKVLDTYPGKSTGSLKDYNAGTEWWSMELTISRAAGKGAYIAFDVPQDVEVGCIQLRMPCTKSQPSMFSAFRGKVGAVELSEAYSNGEVPFVEPGEPGWQETVTKTRKEDQTIVSLQLTCGIKDAQYFGEMFVDFTDVPFPCACKQMCLDTIKEGCRTWKWYEETQHCILQKSVFAGADGKSEQPDGQALKADRASVRSTFEEGTGWWKLPFATGWPGWWTGDTGPICLGFTTNPSPVVAGSTFSLTLTGSAFPLDDSLENNLGARQRIKIVAPDAACSSGVPPDFLSGIGCTNEVTCSPRPAEFTRGSATWTGLKFASAKLETGYKVCWCATDCWHSGSWQEAPGSLVVAPSPYSWAFEKEGQGAVTEDSFAGTGLSLRVSRPAFSSIVDKTSWRLKIVSSEYDCDTLPPAWLGCADAGCAGVGLNLGPDEVVFYVTKDAPVVAGLYLICLSEGGDFFGIPSATARFITVGTPGEKHPRGPFHHQRFSGGAGKTATIGVKGYRMPTNAGSVGLVKASSCMSGTSVVATLSGDTTTSTGDELFFSGSLAADLLGEYTVCQCSDPAYVFTEGELFSNLLAPAASFASDVCKTKCNSGCIGDRCFCDGTETVSFLETDTELCLSPALCRMACEATTGCTGYSVHSTLPRCFLASDYELRLRTETADYEAYSKSAGSCDSAADFLATTAEAEAEINLGTMTITAKPVVGVDYVVAPGEKTSIEVTGTGLDVYKDRVMVIDCYGSCGVSDASPSVSIPEKKGYVEWTPFNALIDRPSVMMRFAPEYPVNPPVDYTPFSKTEDKYCPENLLPFTADTNAAGHRCYSKCYATETCTDESCFCGGFIPGYDTAESSAICLNQQQCEWLCAATPGCHSIDMHKSKDRCFLNAEPCQDHIDGNLLHSSTDYDLLVKNVDDNTRRLQTYGRQLKAAQVRQLLAAKDPGISWESILRFRDVEFTSGGKFKLCFCDSALLSTEFSICDGKEDFKVEIGEIHATGLQCLLSNPKMARGVCTPQLYGGLRCYDDELPSVVIPKEYLGIPDPDGWTGSELTQSFITFCQYAPLEEVTEFSFCSQYRVFEPLPVAGVGSP
jgi:hypothetical protein